MLEKILVPLDGSKLSDKILVHVRRLLHATDADVTLLGVVGTASEAIEARRHLDAVRDELLAEGARATTRVVVGEPAQRILDVAEEIDPSVIALATHGRSGVARVLLGSTATRVLQDTRWPLLLANPFALEGTDSVRFRKVLVALDGTEGSAEVLPIALEIAKLHGAELVLLSAVGEGRSGALVERQLARFSEEHPRRERPRIRIERGTAAERILDALDEEPIDLVALSSTGRGTVDRWLKGSVSDSIIRRCRCPVLVARVGAAARAYARRGP